jgi:hypothetical protein
MEYEMLDANAAKRLKQIPADADLSGEIKLTRFLCEELAQRHGMAAGQLAGQVAKLVEIQDSLQRRNRESIPAKDLHFLARGLGQCLYDVLSEKFPEQIANQCVDLVAERWAVIFAQYKKTGNLQQLAAEPVTQAPSAALPAPQQTFTPRALDKVGKRQ